MTTILINHQVFDISKRVTTISVMFIRKFLGSIYFLNGLKKQLKLAG